MIDFLMHLVVHNVNKRELICLLIRSRGFESNRIILTTRFTSFSNQCSVVKG